MKNSFDAVADLPVPLHDKSPAEKTMDAIYSRRAVRRYKEKLVSKSLIEQVIDAGRMAPSAMNLQSWKFHVLTNRELIDDFAKAIGKAAIKVLPELKVKDVLKSVFSTLLHPHDLSFFKGRDFIFHGAPVVIFVSGRKGNDWTAIDIGACVQNMMLAAKSLGLDTCPIGLAKYVEKTAMVKKLNIDKDDQIYLAIILGYGNENPEIHKRKKENVFYITK